MTDRELWAAAWKELTLTTDPYPTWKKKGFPSSSHWAKAFSLGEQIGVPSDPSADRYVATTGSDANDGSQTTPWRTVRKACASVTAGTIHAAAGTYIETAEIMVPPNVTLVGAGTAATIVQTTLQSGTLMSIRGANTTVTDLTLDGRGKTTASYGLWVEAATKPKILRVGSKGFKAPNDHSGGAINIVSATDLELAGCVLADSGGPGNGFCSGTLGLGGLVRGNVHDNIVTAATGYAVKATGGPITDSQIFNNTFTVGSTTCSTWNTLCVEFFSTVALNSQFHHNTLNGPLSITGPEMNPPLATGYRWRVHHNKWAISSGNFYAVEMSVHSTEFDHNWVVGGLYPVGQFEGKNMQNIDVHHNVFDNQVGPAMAWLMNGGTTNSRFDKNTVAIRRTADGFNLRDGIFSLKDGSTIVIAQNVFYATSPVGDKLGIGLGAATISGNAFWQITPRGSAPTTTNPYLALSGGFPAAYTTPLPGVGAFADGQFSDVGATA